MYVLACVNVWLRMRVATLWDIFCSYSLPNLGGDADRIIWYYVLWCDMISCHSTLHHSHYMHIYIYIERERERDVYREVHRAVPGLRVRPAVRADGPSVFALLCIYIYICIHMIFPVKPYMMCLSHTYRNHFQPTPWTNRGLTSVAFTRRGQQPHMLLLYGFN